jgi:hypothetical protein
MTNEDREWLEAHLRGPVMGEFGLMKTRLDRIEERISDLRERMARVETKAVTAGAAAALIVAPIVAAIVVEVMRR